MKKIFSFTVMILTLISCQQEVKIGYVDNAELINEFQEKKDAEVVLQAKVTAYEKRRDSLSQAFQLELQDAEIKSRSMSQTDVQKLQQEFQQKEQVIAQRLQFEQQQIAQESQAKNDTLVKKVKDFVKDYGAKNGYNFILGSNEAGSVMYGKEAYDLTKTISDALNVKYKKD